jgi:hypothetical protein
MDEKTLFYIGLILGCVAGILGTLVVVKVKSLFTSGEVRRLRHEKRNLEKRLQEKDKYIHKMLGHAERLAEDFSKQRGTWSDH